MPTHPPAGARDTFDRLWRELQGSADQPAATRGMAMPMEGHDVATVSTRWRTAALILAAGVMLSWAYSAYRLLDAGISLTYCRAEQEHLQHDVAFLVAAGAGRLSVEDVLAVRAKQDPALPMRLDEGRTLLLRSVTLQFGKDGKLIGLASR